MKRIFAIIIAVCMVLSLAACGGGGSTPAGNKNNVSTTPANNTANTTPANDTAAGSITRGTVSSKVYTNQSLDVRITLDSNWTIFNDEQMAQVQGLAKDIFSGTDVGETLEKTGSLMDFYAQKDSGLTNMNLILQKGGKSLASYSDGELFNKLKSTLKSQFENSGLKMLGYETKKGTFCGAEKEILYTVLDYSGTRMEQYQVWIRTQSDYYAVLTITAPNAAKLNECLKAFTKADGSGISKGPDIPVSGTAEPDWGTLNGRVYTNEFFGFTFTVPNDNWMATDTASLNELAAEDIAKKSVIDVIKEKNQAILFQSIDMTSGDNVSFLVQAGAKEVEAYSDEQLMSLFESSYRSAYDVKSFKVVKINFAGQEKTGMEVLINLNGTDMLFQQLLLRPGGDYYMVVTVTSVNTSLAEMDSWFAELK